MAKDHYHNRTGRSKRLRWSHLTPGIAGLQPGLTGEPRQEPAERHLVVRDPLDLGDLQSGSKIPTEMVSLWTSRPRWIGKVRDSSHGRLLSVCWLRPPVWVSHVICGREPAVPS